MVSAYFSVRCTASAKTSLNELGSPTPADPKFLYRETHSTPALTKMSPSPDLIAWKAIRAVWVDDAQNRLTVVAGVLSQPSWTATRRAMLPPCSSCGSAHPSIRSSIWSPVRPAFSTAALIICTARSSGRISFSDPLWARPIGDRAVETMTASGISLIPSEASEPQRPRSRPMSSFMISFEPAQILVTRASRQARATRYSFM